MKFNSTFIYHTSERRQGVKDPSKFYNEVSFLEGMEQLRCSVDAELFNKVLPGIQPYTKCNCSFDFNPTYNSLRLVAIQPAK